MGIKRYVPVVGREMTFRIAFRYSIRRGITTRARWFDNRTGCVMSGFSDKRFYRSVCSDGSLRYVSREMRADPSESGRASSGTLLDFICRALDLSVFFRSFSKSRNLLYLSL